MSPLQLKTEDVEKALHYVVLFLPGFVATGLFSYATQVTFPEYAFAYIALTTSMLIYFLAAGVTALLVYCAKLGLQACKRFFPQWNVSRNAGAARSPVWLTLLVASLATVALAVVAITLHERSIILEAITRFAESGKKVNDKVAETFRADRLSLDPLVMVLKANSESQNAHLLDVRPPRLKKAGRNGCFEDGYNFYMRVTVGDHIYEGFPAFYKDKTASEILLSPSCVIRNAKSPDAKMEVFPGMLLVTRKDELSAFEFIENMDSQCFRMLYPETYAKCSATPPVAGKPASGR
jgi:hypothetical protein